MFEIDQQRYSFLFSERLEKNFHEQIRKTIDSEVKLEAILESIDDEKKKYIELQRNYNSQNEIINQAKISIQDLTEKNNQHAQIVSMYEERIQQINVLSDAKVKETTDNFTREISNYTSRINDLEIAINKTSETCVTLENSNGQKDLKIKELEKEISHLKEELQITSNDLQDLKNSSKDDTKKIINKTKKAVIDDGVF